MSREIRRVSLDFDWPLDKVWSGYLMPDSLRLPKCEACDGEGLSPEAMALSRTFYPHQIAEAIGYVGWGVPDGAKALAWHDKIGQAEVDNLVAEGRLGTWQDGKWESLPHTADEVNAHEQKGGFGGHDAINRWILIKFRCQQLGISYKCAVCEGHGDVGTAEQRRARDEWVGTEPPTGEGWQVWETVSEGSPITPVFASSAELVDYLSTVGTTWDQKRQREGRDGGPWRRQAAEKFVSDGWANTFIGVEGKGLFEGGRDSDLIEAARDGR